MDLSVIKEKLEKMESANQNSNSVDYSEFFWRPKELGNYTVRVVPSKYTPENPFTELSFHTKIRKYPILSLANFGQQDPVEELRAQLYATSNKENWSLAGKLSPKVRYTVPVIVRGEEDKGVRLWEISQTLYKSFLQLALDEEVGDFTDIAEGCDIKVARSQGAQFIEYNIRAARNSSPLSTDPALAEKWLNEQPNPLECYQKADYAYIKKLLETYINGGVTPAVPSNPVVEAGEKILAAKEAAKETASAPMKLETPKPAVSVGKKTAPKSVVAKFEDLFEDDEPGNTPGNEGDPLPF